MDVTNVNRQLMATTKTVGQVKVEALILLATSLPSAGEDRRGPKFYSSMGAALKLDPTRIQITEFWKVKGDPLARALRNRFKKEKLFPKRKFQCVYSDELVQGKRVPRPYHCHLWFHAGRISHSRRHKAIGYNRAGSS